VADILAGKVCWEECRGERLSIAMVDHLPAAYVGSAVGTRFSTADSVLGFAGHHY